MARPTGLFVKGRARLSEVSVFEGICGEDAGSDIKIQIRSRACKDGC
jgi:hypothetical protein